jgi:dimeric dUTPase (all-alpha-NTP-PPase superfamily)
MSAEKLDEMFALQEKLNSDTNGKEWKSGVSKNGKKINWTRCIYMECCEAIDSFAWKHWKDINKEPDWANLKIEVVDIWHFFLSLGIEEFVKDTVSPHEMMKNLPAYDKFVQDKCAEQPPEDELVIKKFEQLIHKLTLPAKNHFTTSINDFIELGMMIGMTLTQIHQLYIGKNCLNKLRQNHGYKEGKYVKIWNGKEDNVVMQSLLKKTPDITFDKLYINLENIYKRILHS